MYVTHICVSICIDISLFCLILIWIFIIQNKHRKFAHWLFSFVFGEQTVNLLNFIKILLNNAKCHTCCSIHGTFHEKKLLEIVKYYVVLFVSVSFLSLFFKTFLRWQVTILWSYWYFRFWTSFDSVHLCGPVLDLV